jgi:hypothetical protein
MSAIPTSEFAEQMLQLARSAPAFEPTATYDRDGDCIEFIAKPDSFYAERVDDLVTVYFSHGTNEVVGSLITGVSKFYRGVEVPAGARTCCSRCRASRSKFTMAEFASCTYSALGFGQAASAQRML